MKILSSETIHLTIQFRSTDSSEIIPEVPHSIIDLEDTETEFLSDDCDNSVPVLDFDLPSAPNLPELGVVYGDHVLANLRPQSSYAYWRPNKEITWTRFLCANVDFDHVCGPMCRFMADTD